MCETEIVSCRVLNISPTITALLRKVHCNAFFVRLKGFVKPRPRNAPPGRFCPRGTQSAGHGLFESALLLLHKIHAKQKEQHPHKVLLLVRAGGFEPLAFRVGELRQGGIDWRWNVNYVGSAQWTPKQEKAHCWLSQ